jgi:hypothetical protein
MLKFPTVYRYAKTNVFWHVNMLKFPTVYRYAKTNVFWHVNMLNQLPPVFWQNAAI